MKILLLDDYKSFTDIITFCIEEEFGDKVIVDAITGDEDYSRVKDFYYDIIFLDWVINGEKEGSTATKIINEVSHGFAYVVTGYRADKIMRANIKDFICKYNLMPLDKPFDFFLQPFKITTLYPISRHFLSFTCQPRIRSTSPNPESLQ